jgi:hypothetical protein
VGKGVIVKWECIRRSNHFFDALYYAAAPGWYCCVRLADEQQVPEPKPRKTLAQLSEEARRPDGRPWIDRERWHGIRKW